jgi:hypothetical protein
MSSEVDAKLAGVLRIERVLRVDERANAAGALRIGHDVQRQRRLARGFGAEDLHHAAARQTLAADGEVEAERPGRNAINRRGDIVAHAHDGPIAVVLVDAGDRVFERLVGDLLAWLRLAALVLAAVFHRVLCGNCGAKSWKGGTLPPTLTKPKHFLLVPLPWLWPQRRRGNAESG